MSTFMLDSGLTNGSFLILWLTFPPPCDLCSEHGIILLTCSQVKWVHSDSPARAPTGRESSRGPLGSLSFCFLYIA